MPGSEFLFRVHGTSKLITMSELVTRMNEIIAEQVQRDFAVIDEIALAAMNDMLERFEEKTRVEVFDANLINRGSPNTTLGNMTIADAIKKFN